VFLILLLNNEEVMGKYRNTTAQNVAGAFIVIAIIVLSTLYGITTLFPEWIA
jgi:Mn2+/Fe2+ NRAMP family transporter